MENINFMILFLLFFLSLPLFHTQEVLFPTSNQTIYHIGSRIIDPKPNTLFHIKGSEIISVFDYYSRRFKSANYVYQKNLLVRELLFKPQKITYFKNDLFIIVDEDDLKVKLYNLRYSTISNIPTDLIFEKDFSILVNSFFGQDLIILFGKEFLRVYDINNDKILLNYSDSNANFKALNYFPEKQIFVAINGDSLITWKMDIENKFWNATNPTVLTDQAANYSHFIEKVINNTMVFICYDQFTNSLLFWDLHTNQSFQNYSLQNICLNKLNGVKSLKEHELVLVCEENKIFLYDTNTSSVHFNDTLTSNIVDFIVVEDKVSNHVALLLQKGNVMILTETHEICGSYMILTEQNILIDEIIDITYLNFMSFLHPQGENTGMIAVTSQVPCNKTAHFLNIFNGSYISNITFDKEIRKIKKIGLNDSFLICFDDEIIIFNETSLQPLWNYTTSNFNIDLIDVISSGDSNFDNLLENNFILLYSKHNPNIIILKADGQFIQQYSLSGEINDIKLFCMVNTVDSILYITTNESLIKLSFNPSENAITYSNLLNSMENITRCKNALIDYQDKTALLFDGDNLTKLNLEDNIIDMVPKKWFSQIIPNSDGIYLIYDIISSIATAVTYNIIPDVTSKKINSNFKEATLLYNKHFYLSGFYFNEKESYETLFETQCDEAFNINQLGVCIKPAISTQFLDEYSSVSLLECPESTYIISNYLETTFNACRNCSLDIQNCLKCSSSSNCLECESGYYRISQKDKPNQFPFCLKKESIENLDNFSSLQLINIEETFNWCSNLFPECLQCNQTSCLSCENNKTIKSDGFCDMCDSDNLVFINSTCLKCIDVIENCDKCSQTNSTLCTKCLNNYYFNIIDNSCISCSPESYPNMFISGEFCEPCSKAIGNCLKCEGNVSECSVCQEGFFLFEDKKCHSCNETINMVVINSTCVNCTNLIENCDECSDTSLCLKCKNGLYLDQNENKCLNCSNVSYPNMFVSGNFCEPCSKAIENCINCEGNQNECSLCKEGWSLSLDKKCGNLEDKCISANMLKVNLTCQNCSDIIENCDECLNSTMCTKCFNNFYFDKTVNICINCSNESYPDRFIYGRFCELCSSAIENCIKCDKENECSLCKEGWSLSLDKKCEKLENQCISANMIKVNLTCQNCSIIIENCEECSNSTMCTKCLNNFYFDKALNICINCSNESYPDRFIYGQFCELCSSVNENCINCDNENECTLCKEGWSLSLDKKCEKLEDQCIFPNMVKINSTCLKCSDILENCDECLNSTTCSKCLNNFYFNVSNNICINCSNVSYPDQFISGQFCQLCSAAIENCISCDDENKCSLCKEGFSLSVDKKCEQLQDLCTSQSSVILNSKCVNCSDIIENCDECSNSTFCTKCLNNFYFNIIDNSCINCSNESYPDHYISGQFCQVCSAALENCLKCNGNENECSICKDGFSLSVDKKCHRLVDSCNSSSLVLINSECVNCSDLIENCDECSNSTTCTQCKSNYYFNILDNSCINCTSQTYANMFISGQFCQLCSEALENCITCEGNENQCTSCTDGFVLSDDKKCHSCEHNGEMFLDSSNNCISCSSVFPDCKICNISSYTCEKCQEYQYLDIRNSCTPCNSPEFYKQGSFDGSGKCYSCSLAINNCEFCENHEICKKCEPDYYVNEEGKCRKCDSDDVFIQGTNDGYGLCYLCSSKLENCNKCYGDPPTCLLCHQNHFFKDDGSCVLNCDRLDFPSYYSDHVNDGSGKCKKCSGVLPNCDVCAGDPNFCEKCEIDFYFNDNQSCIPCTLDNETKIGENDGYGRCKFAETPQKCAVNIENCEVCNDISEGTSECLQCKMGYYITQDHICDKCSNECLTCVDRRNNCLECMPKHYYPENIDETHCVKCNEENELLDDGICYIFSKPSKLLNNTVIEKETSISMSSNNNLELSIKDLCVREGSSQNASDVNIFYVLASKSIEFEKIDFKYIKKQINQFDEDENIQDSYNYINSDDECKLFGATNQNNLTIFIRHYYFHYTLKYYCIDSERYSMPSQYNLIHINTKPIEQNNAKIYLNFDNLLKEEINEVSLSRIICILEEISHLIGKNLLKTSYKGKTINCLSKFRYLELNHRNMDDLTLENYINQQTVSIELENDPNECIYNTSVVMNKMLQQQNNFPQKFNENLQINRIFSTFPKLTSYQLFSSDFSSVITSLPVIDITITQKLNNIVFLNISNTDLIRDCIIFLGLTISNNLKKIPSFENLESEDKNKDFSFNYLFKHKLWVHKNSSYLIKISNLSTDQQYNLFYATENMFLNNQSQIFSLKFSSNQELKGFFTEQIKSLIMAAVGGIFTLIIISCLIYCIIKRTKKKKSDKYVPFQSMKDNSDVHSSQEFQLAEAKI